ncbi:MAG: hypothetical protein ACLQLT_04405 [Methylovirgula sp.]
MAVLPIVHLTLLRDAARQPASKVAEISRRSFVICIDAKKIRAREA